MLGARSATELGPRTRTRAAELLGVDVEDVVGCYEDAEIATLRNPFTKHVIATGEQQKHFETIVTAQGKRTFELVEDKKYSRRT